MSLHQQLKDEMKNAMRAKDKLRLGVIRMALSAIKQAEIDHGTEATDDNIIAVLTKMVKQRKDAAQQFEQAGRNDLMETELAEIDILSGFLPQALSASELDDLIQQALTDTQAAGMQDMGKVMAWLKPKVQGRADMGKLSGQIKAKLG